MLPDAHGLPTPEQETEVLVENCYPRTPQMLKVQHPAHETRDPKRTHEEDTSTTGQTMSSPHQNSTAHYGYQPHCTLTSIGLSRQ